jgi:hypothetical protein
MRNHDHDIVVSCLRHIQSWLKRNTPLNDLHPSKKEPWRFVFIVPFGMADTFKSQNLIDEAGKTNIVVDWPEKVQQYVLELEEESIFGRSDSSATGGVTGTC